MIVANGGKTRDRKHFLPFFASQRPFFAIYFSSCLFQADFGCVHSFFWGGRKLKFGMYAHAVMSAHRKKGCCEKGLDCCCC